MNLNIPELRALVAAATPGDWNADHLEPSGLLTMVSSPSTWVADTDVTADRLGEANAAFIAASRSAIPALLDRVEQLEAESDQVQALKEGLREAIDWATGATGPDDPRWKRPHCSETIPQFTGLGDRNRTERLAALAKLVGVKP